MTDKNSRKSYLFAGLTVLMWSTVATAFKIGLFYTNPANLLFISSLTSLIFFSALFYSKNKFSDSVKLKGLLNSSLFGFLNPFLYYLILFEAYKLLPAQIAQPLNYTWVIVVTLLTSVFLKQRQKLISIVGLKISFAGVVVLSSQGSIPGLGDISLFGIFLALSSSIFWGVYWLLNLKDTRNDIEKMMLNFAFGTLYILIYIMLTQNFEFNINVLFAGIYIGLFEMGVTFYVWFKALKYAESTAKTGSIIYLSPFISLIFISIVLGEPIALISIIGLILIISGILLPKVKEVFIRKSNN
ncbi:MAG: DMT family transporter [Candidatus Kapabacteria bacterium]|nr:DMT family transporter [Ignavibacteriota bacterium]MCW5883460.1 DMT family transporter [Candidatus Kapabacteria bacterium]